MLKPNKLCKICNLIKDDKKLIQHIYDTTAYSKSSRTTLAQLARDYSNVFNYDNLKNHVKKHQFMSAEDFKTREMRHIASQAEKQIIKRKLDSVEVWDTVVDTGMEMLENGEMRIDAKDLLKAAKDRSDYSFKKQDNELRLAEMVAFFTSGAHNQELSRKYDTRTIEGETVTDINPADISAGSIDEGESRPSTVYYPPSWDAAS